MPICLILHILCNIRFEGTNDRGNIIYSSIFFVAGGLIYLYRDELKTINRIWKVAITIVLLSLLTAYYFLIGESLSIIILFIVFALLSIVGISLGGYQEHCYKTRCSLLRKLKFGDIPLSYVCVQDC